MYPKRGNFHVEISFAFLVEIFKVHIILCKIPCNLKFAKVYSHEVS